VQADQYISGFGEVLLFLIAGLLFIGISLTVSRLLRPNRPNPEKQATYESGEETIGSAWTQFNIRFYIVALIFLLFEIEILLLFPWATVFANKDLIEQTNGLWGWFAVVEALLFILILVVGLAYAWRNGHLDWVKPDPRPTVFSSPVPKDLYARINEKYKTSLRKEDKTT